MDESGQKERPAEGRRFTSHFPFPDTPGLQGLEARSGISHLDGSQLSDFENQFEIGSSIQHREDQTQRADALLARPSASCRFRLSKWSDLKGVASAGSALNSAKRLSNSAI